MSPKSIIMMIITVLFYGIGFGYLINKAFNAKQK